MTAYHPQGVFFGLDDRTYLDDPALGSTDVRLLLQSPSDYWHQSALNPHRPAEQETPALLYGRALHKLVLEGSDAFKSSFCKAPDKRDYPDALITVEHLEGYLDGREIKRPVRARKADLEALARAAGALIWSDIVAKHEVGNRSLLKPDMYDSVVEAASQIAGSDKLKSAFQNGRAEVSVFFELDGVPCKCRYDYVKAQVQRRSGTASPVINLKSFRPKNAAAPDVAVANAIAGHRYDVQAALHLKGRQAMAQFIREERVYAQSDPGIPSRAWLKTLADEASLEAWLIFFQAEGAPNVLRRFFRAGSAVMAAADADLAMALAIWRDEKALRPEHAPWVYQDPLDRPELDVEPEITFDTLPKWFKSEIARP